MLARPASLPPSPGCCGCAGGGQSSLLLRLARTVGGTPSIVWIEAVDLGIGRAGLGGPGSLAGEAHIHEILLGADLDDRRLASGLEGVVPLLEPSQKRYQGLSRWRCIFAAVMRKGSA